MRGPFGGGRVTNEVKNGVRSVAALPARAVSMLPRHLERLGTSAGGLSEAEAAVRLEQHGSNVVAAEQHYGRLRLFMRACVNPLVILLAILAAVSLATGDVRAAVVMTAMIILGVVLRFTQEARADAAAEKLRAMIRVTTCSRPAGSSSRC